MKTAIAVRKIGLARALSKLGYCSRSQAAELIRAGRIRVNGALRWDPEAPVHLEKDRIDADQAEVTERQKIYLALNKPRGVVTTASDERERKTVYDCLGEQVSWVAPVGRLDKASEGLLLLTNDSEWADRILAPKTHLDKIYHVQVARLVDERLTHKLEKGIRTRDGDFLRVRKARILRQGQRNTWLEVSLDEGKNRHIRRLLEHVGIEVVRLMRVSIGPLGLGELAKGAYRHLTTDEKLALDQALKERSLPTVRVAAGTNGKFGGKENLRGRNRGTPFQERGMRGQFGG